MSPRSGERPRALLIEPCPYHWELFPPWCALMDKLGWDLDVAAVSTAGHREALALLDGGVRTFAAERLREIPLESYSLVILGTLVHEGYRFDPPIVPGLELLAEIGLPSLGVIHEPQLWAQKGPALRRHLTGGQHEILTFTPQGSAYLAAAPGMDGLELPWLLPFKRRERQPPDRTGGGFVFPGSIDYDRKAIPSLLRAAATLPPGESVLIVGGSRKADFEGDRWVRLLRRQIAEQALHKKIRFTGYLPFGEFLARVGSARFLLPLIDAQVDGGSYLTKMPAAVPLALGLGVPLILDETIARHFGLEFMVSYRDDDLAAGIAVAKRLSDEEYAHLRRLTDEAAERLQARNLRTLGEILGRLAPSSLEGR